jgi:RND family efflux transporter MFP subunit
VALGVRILLPIVLLVVGGVGYSVLSKKKDPPPAPRPTPKAIETRVMELKREDYQIMVPAQGAIRAHSQVSLTAQVAGRVQTIHPQFEEGAFFREGDVLLELDPVDFRAAVIAANAQLAQARLLLAQEKVRAEQALLDWKNLGYENEKPSELVRRVPQLLAAQENKKLAESQLETANRNLERARIRAPFDGRVLTRSVGIGQTIGASTPLAEIFATDYSEVRLPVSTRWLSELKLPEDVDDPPLAVVLRDALVESSELRWDAQILRTEGALDTNTLELFAIARIEDPYGLDSEKTPLRVGQPVAAEIPGRILEDVFVIPRDAVSGLSRIRLVEPESLTLRSAQISPLWSDNDSFVFHNEKIPDGMLLAMTKLVYAPDGARVEIVEDELPADPEEPGGQAAGSKEKEGTASK